MYIVPQFRGDEKLKYLRKSRTDDPLLSVEEILRKHEEEIDEWVEQHQPEGGPIPEENTYREIVSGETIASRPRMQELLRRIESPKIKAVVVKELSRLSRGDLEDIGYLVKILRYTNTIVVTPRYAYDLNDDRDREDFERELMRGNGYLEYQKTIMQAGTLRAVKGGQYVSAVPPYGYKRVRIKEEGRRAIHTLEPIPEQAEVVRMIFELYRDGTGSGGIADRLNELHIPSPRGQRWHRDSVKSLLSNVHYLGKVKRNERKTVKVVEDGRIIAKRQRAEEFLIVDGLHPAILDQELWDAVQTIRGQHPRTKKSHDLINPLSGLLRCECGASMVWRVNKRVRETTDSPRFKCPHMKHCGNASVLAELLMAEVENVLREAIADFEIRIESSTDDSAERHRQKIAMLERRLEELQALEVKQWDEKTKGGMPAHVFDRLNGQTVAEIEEIQQALYEAKNEAPEPEDLQAKVATFHEALAALRDPDAPVKEKNKLLKACIEQITYGRDRTDKRDLPGKGQVSPFRLDVQLRV